MKGKTPPNGEPTPWRAHTTSRQRSNLWLMTLAGLPCLGGAVCGLGLEAPLPALGMLLLGLGLTAAGASFLLGCYRQLTDRGVLWAALANRAGLLLLGPAVALILQPWREVASGLLTKAQCAGICALLCGGSILPCGISLARIIPAWRNKAEGHSSLKKE